MKRLPNRCVHCNSPNGDIREEKNHVAEVWYYSAEPSMWGPFCSKAHVALWNGEKSEDAANVVFGSHERLSYFRHLVAHGQIHDEPVQGTLFIDVRTEVPVIHLHCTQCSGVSEVPINGTTCPLCCAVI